MYYIVLFPITQQAGLISLHDQYLTKMTKFDSLTINTFNCRGIRCESKRSVVFNWLKHYNSGSFFLQETHSFNTDEDQ